MYRILLILIFAVLPTPVFAQTGILSLPKGKNAIGLGVEWYDPPPKTQIGGGNYYHRFRAQNIRGSLDYHFNRQLKVSFIPGIAFLSLASRNAFDVSPSPSAELRLTITGALDTEKTLDYFLRGAFRANYMQIHSGGRGLHYVNTALTGGTVTEWQFNPFFGVFYSNIWRNTSTTRQIIDNDTYNLFTGEASVEIEASPM